MNMKNKICPHKKKVGNQVREADKVMRSRRGARVRQTKMQRRHNDEIRNYFSES